MPLNRLRKRLFPAVIEHRMSLEKRSELRLMSLGHKVAEAVLYRRQSEAMTLPGSMDQLPVERRDQRQPFLQPYSTTSSAMSARPPSSMSKCVKAGVPAGGIHAKRYSSSYE